MSDALKMRHILAAVYGDTSGEASYVLFELYPGAIPMAFAARQLAISFDASPVAEGRHGGTSVQTPAVYGEFVLGHLPEWLSDWADDKGDVDLSRVHLLPISMHDQLERLKDGWRNNEHGIYWGSRNCRFQCDEESIRLAIDDKYTDDITVWTRNFLPILEALSQAFDRDAMSYCDMEKMTYEEVAHG